MENIYKKILASILKNRLFYLLFVVAIYGVFYFPNQHDYFAYVKEWDKIIGGEKPYNAYGVVFHFFSFPNFVHPKLPKLIFVLSYFIAVHKIYLFSGGVKIINRILLLNPLFWIFGIVYGSNDTFVSSVTLLAVLSLINDNMKTSGFLFSLGINLKYTPLSILPFLVLSRKRIKKEVLFSFLLVTIIFLCVGYYFWGTDLMHGFMFNINRDSSIFSIFRFINGKYHPLQFVNIQSLDFLSVYLVVIVWGLGFLFYIKFNLDKYLMLLLSYSNILLLYKSGHHQFYILFFMLTFLIYIIHKEKMKTNKILLNSFIFFWVWILVFTIIYPLTNQYSGVYKIREWLGFPTFLIHLFLNIQLIIYIIKERKYNLRITTPF